ncbi:ATP-binding SpoIIE family protein phosphatase [Streptomyces glomeratus]|uniref:SpoIIE family protein phosphatase n=1 Tax=Streptomyces glomeratus TaxID=284452 RepID=A0ABP6LDU1_9ACTN|nr:ATP-binding SpoIIE family protein phosphatase [Streptomyces glomeratus]MCF1511615.1 SpoIIE family protein phosphatase [Streptomyces glomeratus]
MSRIWDVPVHDATRVRDVRVAVEQACDHAGFGEERAAAAVLVATELATNLLKHAGGGQILLETVDAPAGAEAARERSALQIVTIDHGPGIRDLSAALQDGFSTTASLGAGLGTCRRVADDFDLHSTPGRGTVALARIRPSSGRRRGPRDRPAGAPVRAGGVNIPLVEGHSGDAWACVRSGERLTLLLADGLGHGPRAAEASDAAVRQLRLSPHLTPPELLGTLHTALRETRGAAVAVAQLDLAAQRLEFSGIGNVGARLRSGDDWQPLVSHPGIVGAHRPAHIPHQTLPWNPGCLLVLHSDGLPSRWSLRPDVPAAVLDPGVTAALILRDSSSSARPVRDDTTVAVLSPITPNRES